MEEETAYRCKYCHGFFVNKAVFNKHKREQHWEEMSHRSELSSIMSANEDEANMPPPPGRQRLSRVKRPTPTTPSPARRPGRPRVEPPDEEEEPPPPPSPRPRGRPATSPTKKARAAQPEPPDSPPSSPPPRKRKKNKKAHKKKRPGPPEGTDPRNLPRPYGQKRTVTNAEGEEQEEFIRNPKVDGG